jgi:hypothetical protein
MGRNLFRRIEVAWPVLDKKLKQRVIDEGLAPYLADTADAWLLDGEGGYRPARAVIEASARKDAAAAKKGRGKKLGALHGRDGAKKTHAHTASSNGVRTAAVQRSSQQMLLHELSADVGTE